MNENKRDKSTQEVQTSAKAECSVLKCIQFTYLLWDGQWHHQL